MEIIQLNKFSILHNGETIIFCKTDYLSSEFENIKRIKNDVVLISGNSDYGITDDIINELPNNVIRWYAQNALVNHEKLIPIPMGIENKLPSLREDHGIGYYERVELKETLLKRNIIKHPTKKIYSNFNVDTNPHHRNQVKHICESSNHIYWETPNLSLETFFDNILDYEMIVCPAGNGVDTHRLWEVLYSNRIPITVKIGDYKIYELYEQLPIIILDSIEDLGNIEIINFKLMEIYSKTFNLETVDLNYWINKIKQTIIYSIV